jgi:hypothetical protein
MTRVLRVCGKAVLSALSAFGASQLALVLGLGPAVATLACMVAFLSNFSMIDGFADQASSNDGPTSTSP